MAVTGLETELLWYYYFYGRGRGRFLFNAVDFLVRIPPIKRGMVGHCASWNHK